MTSLENKPPEMLSKSVKREHLSEDFKGFNIKTKSKQEPTPVSLLAHSLSVVYFPTDQKSA